MTNYFKKYIKQDIFKNIQYLDPKCPPKEFKYRENEMATIASKISPILYGSTPIHAVILGDNATGKTTAIQTLFKEIKRDKKRMMKLNRRLSKIKKHQKE